MVTRVERNLNFFRQVVGCGDFRLIKKQPTYFRRIALPDQTPGRFESFQLLLNPLCPFSVVVKVTVTYKRCILVLASHLTNLILEKLSHTQWFQV